MVGLARTQGAGAPGSQGGAQGPAGVRPSSRKGRAMTCPPRGPVSWGKWVLQEIKQAHSSPATRDSYPRHRKQRRAGGRAPAGQAGSTSGFQRLSLSCSLCLLHCFRLSPLAGGPFLPPLLVNFYLPSRADSNVTSSEKPPETPPAKVTCCFFGFLFPLLCV